MRRSLGRSPGAVEKASAGTVGTGSYCVCACLCGGEIFLKLTFRMVGVKPG